jgi:prostaglandin-endoperoxide synthase 2
MRRPPFSSTWSKVIGVALVTLTEGSAVYVWLRLHDDGHVVWGFVALVAGEMLETFWVARPLKRAESRIPIGDPYGAARHRRRFAARFGAAFFGELGIWAVWLWLAADRRVDEPIIAAAVLVVLMHLKHQLEVTTVRDIGYFSEFWRGTIASASEAAGAVGCLALIEADEPLLAAAALAAGFLVEHTLLILRLAQAVEERDISVPRLRQPPLQLYLRVLAFFGKRVPWLWRLVQGIGPLDRALNRTAIDRLVRQVPPRPNPLSTMAPYTSWASLTDRSYNGRYLTPAAGGARGQPPLDAVAELFRREGDMESCPKSTVLFASFAQWFVDGFLRTERATRKRPRNTLRNESTHDVDLAQLYGLNAAMTDALRAKSGGRLRSTTVNGEEFPELLCRRGRRKQEFKVLPKPLGFNDMTRDERSQLFAMGTDVHSVGFTALNVLFLREHNRIARQLQGAYGWDDDRLFQTARIILVVVLLRIVIEDYINHITSYYFRFRFPPPGTFDKTAWFRQNWMAVEFNLLYRWHPLIPRTLRVADRELTTGQMLLANDVLTTHGLRTFLLAASEQRAGRIGLFNTDPTLVAVAEAPTVQQGRTAELRSYNDYRELCRLPRLRHFGEFSTDEHVVSRLHALYDHVDEVEFYVGLFAEQAGEYEMLPPLMTAMVSFDAFSQVLTNPLLAPNIFGPDTFSPIGMEIIDETRGLDTLIRRNIPDGNQGDRFSMTWRDYRGP